MKLPKKFLKKIVPAAGITCLCGILCGCHVFPWYVPKEYGDAEKAAIYAYIRDEVLTAPKNYIAEFDYTDPDDGTLRSVNIWNCGGKLIMNFDVYSERGQSVWYEGVLKQWNAADGTESVNQSDLSDFDYAFDYIDRYAEYLKTVVGTDYDDGYFHRCEPWDFGMAQIYYTVDPALLGAAEANLTARWETHDEGDPVTFASFNLYSDIGDISLEMYSQPYDIDACIENVLKNYEESKTRQNI